MLKRIQKISNIGRFSDCSAPGCEFGNETIIFGLNTHGKSTLTAILRSIQTGNSDILIGRKTFGATGAKNVEIDFDEGGIGARYTFQARTWNKSNPNILIFDSKFIAENVFDGEHITFDQQKNLNTVIIGKKGQDLNTAIAILQKQADDFASQKSEKTREFSRHFSNLDFTKFKSLAKDIEVESKLKNKEKEIKFEHEREEIKKSIKSHILSLSRIRFSIKNTIAKTLDVKQEEMENHIKAHLLTEENAQNFLSDGVDLLKATTPDGLPRSCVFCGQQLDQNAEKLISIYSAFFKGGYEDLQKEIVKETDYFKEVNVEALLEKILADLKSKDLDVGLGDVKIAELAKWKKEFEKELDKKRDLNYAVNFDSFDCLQLGIEKIKNDLEDLEEKKLNVTPSKDVSQLEIEKKTLEIFKKRYEPAWVKFCSDWDLIESESEKVRKEREEKRKELEIYSASVFDTHKGTINSLCENMGADFQIEDFKPLKKIVGKDERIFAIKFFGTHKVRIDSEDQKTPNFRNTLSESDKRLLAFALFMSLLMHDRELDKKIVVFDDPMSSFDSERCRKTVHRITDIASKYKDVNGSEKILLPGQKIILTHEDRFAKELKRLMPNACTLKIEEYMDGSSKRSRISHADYAQDFPDDDISYRIEKIKGILDNREFATPFEEDCRVVLEHIFKRKYYLELKDAIVQRKSVRTFTINLMQSNIGGFEDVTKSQKFIRLCEDLNIELHDGNDSNSNGDRESILKDFFECLKEI